MLANVMVPSITTCIPLFMITLPGTYLLMGSQACVPASRTVTTISHTPHLYNPSSPACKIHSLGTRCHLSRNPPSLPPTRPSSPPPAFCGLFTILTFQDRSHPDLLSCTFLQAPGFSYQLRTFFFFLQALHYQLIEMTAWFYLSY